MIKRCTINEYEKGVLFIGGRLKKELGVGAYYFPWFLGYKVVKIDSRIKQVKSSAQEIITKDKASCKFTLSLQYQILDIKKYLSVSENTDDFIYQAMQESLRTVITSVELEEAIEERINVSDKIKDILEKKLENYGITAVAVYLNDVILTARLKEIFTKDLEQKKLAKANLAFSQEQVANARASKNLTEMYKNDPILLKLLEIQTIREIADKNVTVVFNSENNKSA